MQRTFEGKLAQYLVPFPRYQDSNKGGNEIGEKGVAHLSKAKWDNKQISLGL